MIASSAALAAPDSDCPGHPDALGISRTLVVDPREHPRIGGMQYPESLPLRDHEVVLTFDDGPLPKYSNQVLQILADQCVKATFFTIGSQAQANPEGVRKLAAAGHTIGTHSQTHPLGFGKMPIEKAEAEIDQGIASVTAALDDPSAVAPFFRIPGLRRAEGVEDYLASRGIQLWSADFPADDWHHISSTRVYEIAMKRLEAKGKGILLLHDIQARTAAALPRILHELKAKGFHIVHVVPATAQRPATPTLAQEWRLHPSSQAVAIVRWPEIPQFVFAETGMLPAPVLPDFDAPGGELLLSAEPFDRARWLSAGAPLPREAPWPRQTVLAAQTAVVTLPIPAESLFEIPEKAYAALQPLAPVVRRAEQGQGKLVHAHGGNTPPALPASALTQAAGTAAHDVLGANARLARPHGGSPKRPMHAQKGARHPLRLATLKKR